MTPEQKALRACADYARLSGEIKRLTRAIGETFDHCPGVGGTRLRTDDWNGTTVDDKDPTHLHEAYAPDVQGFPPEAVYMESDDIREYLVACLHCLAAHEAIQARKAARKSLGAAKRAITMIGRRANQQPPTAQDSHA